MADLYKTEGSQSQDAEARDKRTMLAEREACAQIADDRAAFWFVTPAAAVSEKVRDAREKEARIIAAAIRARGET
jgi:hypothetical protein